MYGQQFVGIRDQNCPAGGYALENDQWYFALDQFPLAVGKQNLPPLSASLLTLIHTDTFAVGDAQNCHLEQEYFVREMGKVRHEAYYNLDCGASAYYDQLNQVLAADPGDCVPLSLNPPIGNWKEYSCAAYVRSAPPSGTADDNPQKANAILAASNLTSVLFNAQPTDNPSISSITPSVISRGNTTTQLTLHGSFPVNPWFGNNVKVMFSGGGATDKMSDLGYVTTSNTQVVFTISQQDWNDSGLQCGTAYIRVFDGVSTSNTVPLSIVSPNC